MKKNQSVEESLRRKKMKNNYISVGKILNFHGVRGEAKLGYSKNREDFLSKLEHVFIQLDGEFIPVEVLGIKFTPKCAIIKFKGICYGRNKR